MSHSPPELWDGVLRRLGADMAIHTLDAWLRPLGARLEGGRVRLLCPTAFHRDRVRSRFRPLVERHVAAELGRDVEVEWVVEPPDERPPARPARTEPPASPPEPSPPRPGREQRRRAPAPSQPVQVELPYRFDNFVVGSCNALAREASLAMAEGRQRSANPLFLSGREGLGKTHLARAIAAEAGGRDGRVVYASAETFTNDFTASIRDRQMDRFKRRYRFACRLLVMEDVQFLEAKRKTQLELFHTMTHLLDVGARVVFTGDRLPRDLEGLHPRLRSQMAAGLVAEIEPPDAAVRREILRRKAAAGGVRIPEDCLELLVASVRGNVRDLEGVLIQLVASASLLKRPIDTELTRAALHKLQPGGERRLQPMEIVETVAAFFRTGPDVLAGRSRRRDVLWPRQLAMVLCRRYTEAPYSEIARIFGRQHTAVRNAERVVERAMLESAPRRYQVEALTARIEALPA